MARILGINNQWVNKQSWDFRSDSEGRFAAISMLE